MPTALIVEDEPEANRLLSMLVQLRGYQTESAFTGGEALGRIEDSPPDVVFLDLMLPDTDGYDVCRSIKARRETSLIPVVMVTARLAAENRAQSFLVGAFDYVPKPYTPDQIFRALAGADAWRRDAERGDGHGILPFRHVDDDAYAQELSRMRSLLLAHSPLTDEAVAAVCSAIGALRVEARRWACKHPGAPDPTAAARYEIHPDHLAIAVQDEPGAGWIASLADPHALPAATLDPFDDANRPHPGTLYLTRRFAGERS